MSEADLIKTSALSDGAWAWPGDLGLEKRYSYAAQYTLWLMNPRRDSALARYVIPMAAEPALLSPHLRDSERDEWIRLMGDEARASEIGSPSSAYWNSMFLTLISSGQMRESSGLGWRRGKHFSDKGLNAKSVDSQRTAFALDAVRRVFRVATEAGHD